MLREISNQFTQIDAQVGQMLGPIHHERVQQTISEAERGFEGLQPRIARLRAHDVRDRKLTDLIAEDLDFDDHGEDIERISDQINTLELFVERKEGFFLAGRTHREVTEKVFTLIDQ